MDTRNLKESVQFEETLLGERVTRLRQGVRPRLRTDERASSADKTLRLWPHMKHEIFNEVDGQTVISYMLDWLDARLPSKSG